MAQASYLMCITGSQKNVELILAILNIAGRGQAFHSSSNEMISTNLWIVPKGKRNREEVIALLQALPTVHSVSVIALSNPVQEKELVGVRELFALVGWDANAVTNEALSLFINAKLNWQYTYYIDYDHKKRGLVTIQVKPIEEHPHFSLDWLKTRPFTEEENPEREFTIDDIEIRSVVIGTTKKLKPPPPPASSKK